MSAAERLVRLAAITPRDRRDPLAHYITTLLTADPDLAQDIADGEALRRLREALPEGWRMEVRVNPFRRDPLFVVACAIGPSRGRGRAALFESGHSMTGSIAAAADACRVALEASRA